MTPLTTEPKPATTTPLGRRGRRRLAVTAIIVLVLAGAATVVVTDPLGGSKPSNPGGVGSGQATSLATVSRRDLTSETAVPATLGYAGSYTVVYQSSASGQPSGAGSSPSGGSTATFTTLPSVGQVISQGQSLYSVNGAPVVLLYGTTPAYRSLSEGVSGTDVTELNADLVALGYATSGELSPSSDYFSAETAVALEKLQAALGTTENGALALGQAVFLPSAVRVTTVSAVPGGAAQSGSTVLQATSITRQVSIALDAGQQSEVKVGDKVTITLPDSQTTPGTISSVGTVATSSGSSSPTITVDVTPTDPAATGGWDQAPVEVSIITASVTNVLVVPVDALLARSSGGYAVEVVGVSGVHYLVSVSLGLFDDADGLVQVSGPGLSAGQRVVVPAL